MGRPGGAGRRWKALDPTTNAEKLKGTALVVAYGNGEVRLLDNGVPSPWDPVGETEREIGLQGAALVERLGELSIPVIVDACGNGTDFELYFSRDLHRSFPMVLEALGEQDVRASHGVRPRVDGHGPGPGWSPATIDLP